MMRLSKMPSVLPLLAALIVVFGAHLSSGQAPPPMPDCDNALFALAPCLDFVSNSSVNTVPPLCCGALTNLSTSSPVCLCEFISPDYANQGAALGINATKALELPGLCSLSVSVSSCAALLGPATAPALAPMLAPVLSPPALAPVLVPTPVLAPIIVPPALAPVTIPPPMPMTPVPAASPIPGADTPVTTPSSSPETPAPGPAEDCQSELVPLLPCLEFLKDTDNSPSKDCCTNLKNVVDTSPTCICSLASSGSTSAIPGINSTRALELPALCEINVSLSTCTGGPSTSPLSFPPGGDDSGVAVKAALPSLFMAACILVVSSFVLLQSHSVDLWLSLFV